MTKKHFRGFKKFTKKRRKYQKGGNCCDYEPEPRTRDRIDCQHRDDWTRRDPSIDYRNIWFTIFDPSGNINVIYHVIKHMDSFFNKCNEGDMPIFEDMIRDALNSQRYLVPRNTKKDRTEIVYLIINNIRSSVVFTRYSQNGPLTIFQIVPVNEKNEPRYAEGNNYMFETRKTSITKKLLDSKLTDIEFDDNYQIMKNFRMLLDEKVSHLLLRERIGRYNSRETKTFYKNLFEIIKSGDIAVNDKPVSEITVKDFLQFVLVTLDKNPPSSYIDAIIGNNIDAAKETGEGYSASAAGEEEAEPPLNATNNGAGAGEGYPASAAGEEEAKAYEEEAAPLPIYPIQGKAEKVRKKLKNQIDVLKKKKSKAKDDKKNEYDTKINEAELKLEEFEQKQVELAEAAEYAGDDVGGGRTKIKKTRKRKKIRGKTTRRM